MVNAAVKYALAEAPTTCSTPDKAKLEILNSLNWLEAHDEYEWPDFQLHGLDFAQAMKLRRALVNDVFIGMNKGGHLRITPTSGGPAAPSSGQGPPSGERLRLKRVYSDVCSPPELTRARQQTQGPLQAPVQARGRFRRRRETGQRQVSGQSNEGSASTFGYRIAQGEIYEQRRIVDT
jgi:hypothetical protein